MKVYQLINLDTNAVVREGRFPEGEQPILKPEKRHEWRLKPDPAPPTLAEVKASKHFEINRWRKSQEQNPAPILHEGNYFDVDPDSREKIQMVIMAGQNPLGYWTSADNVDVPFTIGDLQDLFGKVLLLGSQIHARQRAMKKAVKDLTTVEEVQNYVVGWGV